MQDAAGDDPMNNPLQLQDADAEWLSGARDEKIVIMDGNWVPEPPGPGALNRAWADYCFSWLQAYPDENRDFTHAGWLEWLNSKWPHIRG